MKEKITAVSFCILLACFFVITVIVPGDKRVEETEHRTLAKMPGLNMENVMGGGFSKEFENYISDNVGFRSSFIGLSMGISELYGMKGENEAQIVVLKPNEGNEAEKGNQATKPSPTPSRTPGAEASEQPETQPGEMNVIEPIQVGSLLKFPDKLMEIYGYKENTAIRYGEVVNSYRKILGDNVKIYTVTVPTQIEFQEEKYRNTGSSELLAINKVNETLIEGITPIDVYSALYPHRDEYIFFRTDHHWTALGAYYAYLAFAETANIVPVTIDNYEKGQKEGFLGYLYNASPSPDLEQNPDTIEYFMLDEKKWPFETDNNLLVYAEQENKPTYSIFIGGDRPLYEINTSVKNGRTCVVIKDSYANCFVPWIAPNYEKIIVIDPRTFEGSVKQTIKDYEDVDLIFCQYVFTTSFADLIEKMDLIK